MLKGYGKLSHRLDVRLPITLPILKRLLASTEVTIVHVCSRLCVVWLFFAFLRIGEITVTSDSADVLQLNQITKFVGAMGNVFGV